MFRLSHFLLICLSSHCRVKLKDGVAFLGARPSNPTLWMVSQDVRTEGHRVVTLHCRRKESSYGLRSVHCQLCHLKPRLTRLLYEIFKCPFILLSQVVK